MQTLEEFRFNAINSMRNTRKNVPLLESVPLVSTLLIACAIRALTVAMRAAQQTAFQRY